MKVIEDSKRGDSRPAENRKQRDFRKQMADRRHLAATGVVDVPDYMWHVTKMCHVSCVMCHVTI